MKNYISLPIVTLLILNSVQAAQQAEMDATYGQHLTLDQKIEKLSQIIDGENIYESINKLREHLGNSSTLNRLSLPVKLNQMIKQRNFSVDQLSKALRKGQNLEQFWGPTLLMGLNEDSLTQLLLKDTKDNIDKFNSLYITLGAKVNMRDQEGMTPLAWTVRNANERAMLELLNLDATLDFPILYQNVEFPLDEYADSLERTCLVNETRDPQRSKIVGIIRGIRFAHQNTLEVQQEIQHRWWDILSHFIQQ